MTPPDDLLYCGLGANLGDRVGALTSAIALLGELVGPVAAVSPWYTTEPVLLREQPWFLNGVVAIGTTMEPRRALAIMQSIEHRLGRVAGPRYGPRAIDLDILVYGDRSPREPGLHIPHPRLSERRFVLQPLSDLAPDLVIPGQGATVRQLLDRLADPALVLPYEGETGGDERKDEGDNEEMGGATLFPLSTAVERGLGGEAWETRGSAMTLRGRAGDENRHGGARGQRGGGRIFRGKRKGAPTWAESPTSDPALGLQPNESPTSRHGR